MEQAHEQVHLAVLERFDVLEDASDGLRVALDAATALPISTDAVLDASEAVALAIRQLMVTSSPSRDGRSDGSA